jgi:hypothetical protein
VSATVASATQIPVDEQVYLLGKPPMGEAVHYLKTQTLEGQTVEVSALADQWRAAHARRRELMHSEAGIADSPQLGELPPELEELAARVLGDQLTRRSFGITPCAIKMVDLDQMVVFQRQVNLNYARDLAAMLGPDPSPDDVLNFTLPIDRRYDPPARVGPIMEGPAGPLAWAMLSPSTDYRVLQTVLLDPSQVSGLDATGAPTQVVAVVVGYGSNFVSAMHVGNRLVLRNGTHRAFTLRQLGHQFAPVLVQTIPEDEEAEHLPPEVLQQRDLYLEQARPPMLRDYFDEALRLVVHLPRRTRQIRVAVNYEEAYAPGL